MINVNNGIDNIRNFTEFFMGKKLGLITNVTGIDKKFESTINIINSEFDLRLLFSPEHGIRGEQQAGESVSSYTDSITGKKVISLYGHKKAPIKEELDEIDALVYDIQDIGVRYYTYIYTMYLSMEACAKYNKEFIVLDRINPLGGNIVEGNILNLKYSSFVGMLEIPNRYALTIGELANFINDSLNINCKLKIVPITNWERGLYQDETDIPWIAPSPNIPTINSAIAYVGTCLFEGTNVSEGRGTTKPFEIIGAPWIDPYKLSEELNSKDLEGVYFRSVYFRPTFSKYANELCAGVQLHILDRDKFSPLKAGLSLLYVIKEMYKEDFSFNSVTEEFNYHFINHLSGTDDIMNPEVTLEAFLNKIEKESEEFKVLVDKYKLY